MSKQKKKKLLKIAIGTIATAAISAAVISSAVSCGSGSSGTTSQTQSNSTTTNNTANLNLDVVDAATNKPLQIINHVYQVALGEKVKVTTSMQNGNGDYTYTCTQDINNSLTNLSLDKNEITLPIDQNSSLTFTATQNGFSYNQTVSFNVVKSTYNAQLEAVGSAADPGSIIGTQLYCSPNSSVNLTFNLQQTTENVTSTLDASNFVAKVASFTLYGSNTKTFNANDASVIGTTYNKDLTYSTSWQATVSTADLTSYKYIIGCFNLPNNQTVYTSAYTTVDSSLTPVSSASNEDFPVNSDGSYSITPTLGVNLEMNKDFTLPSTWKASDVEYNWYYSTDDSTWKQVDISATNSTYRIDSFAGNNSNGIIGAAGWYRLEITNKTTKQTIYAAAVNLKNGPVTGFSPEIMIGSKALQNGESFTMYSTSVPLAGVKFGAVISGVFVPADKLQNAKLTYTVNKGKVQDYSPSTTLLLTEGTNIINISESFEFSGVNFNESVTFTVNCYNTIVLGPSGVATIAEQQPYDAAYNSKITLGPTKEYESQFNGGTYEWYQVNRVTAADGKVSYEKIGNSLSSDLDYTFTVSQTTPTYYELIATMPTYIGAQKVYQSVTSQPIEIVPTISNTTATITPMGVTSENDYYVTTDSVVNVNAAIAYDKMSLTIEQIPDAKVTWTLNGQALTATGFSLSQLNLSTGKNTLSVSITYTFNTSVQTTVKDSITIYYYALQVSPTSGYEEENGDWMVSYGKPVTLQIDTAQQSVFSSGFTYQWYAVQNGTKTGKSLNSTDSYTFTYDTNDTTSYELIATTSGGIQIVSNVITLQPNLQNYTTTQILDDIVNKLSTDGTIDAQKDIPALGSTQITSSNVTPIIEAYLKGKLDSDYTISGAGYNTVNITSSDVSYSVAINGKQNIATVTVAYAGSSQTITVTNFYQESMDSTQIVQSLIEQIGQTTSMNSSTNELLVNASLIFGDDNITNSAVTTTAITDWFTKQVGTSYDLEVPGYVPITIEGTQLAWSPTINENENDATVKVSYLSKGVTTNYTFSIVNFTKTSFTNQQIADAISQKISGTTFDPTSTTTTYTLDISKTTLGSINVADSDASSKINSYVENLISTDFKSTYTISQAGYNTVSVTSTDFKWAVTINQTANTATITITYNGATSTITSTGFTVHHLDAQTILNQVVADWTKNSDPSDWTKNVIDISDINALKDLNVQYEQKIYSTLSMWIPLSMSVLPSSDLTFSKAGYATVDVDVNNITIPNETWTTNSKGVTVGTGGITFPSATAIGSNAVNENNVTVKLTWTYNGQTATTDVTFTGFATGKPDGQTAVGLIVDYFTSHENGNQYYSGNTIGTLDASLTSGPDSIAQVPVTASDLDTKLTSYFDSVIGPKGFEIGAAGLPFITVLSTYLTFAYTPDTTTNSVSVTVTLKNTYDGTAYTGTATFSITNLYLAPIPSQTVVNDIAQKMSDATYTIDASTNSTLKAYYLVDSNIDSQITTYLNGMIGTSGYKISNGSGYQTLTITPSSYTLKVTPDLSSETATVTVTYDGATQTITISDFTPDTLTTSQITSWVANKICDGKTIDAKTTIPSLKTTEIVNSDVTTDIQDYLTSTLDLPQTMMVPGYKSVSLAKTDIKFTVTLNKSANTATVTVEYMGSTTDTATINIDDFYLGTIDDSTIAGDITSNLQKLTTMDASTSTDTALKSIYLINSDATTQIQSNIMGLVPSTGWTITQDGATPVTVTAKDFSMSVTENLAKNYVTVSVTYDGSTSSYQISNFNQQKLVVSNFNIQQIIDSIPIFKNGEVDISKTELSHLSINNNNMAANSYVDSTVLSYLKGYIAQQKGLTVNYPGYQEFTVSPSELTFTISASSNTSYLIVDVTYTSSTNKSETATGSIKLINFSTVTASISDNNVATVQTNTAVPFSLTINSNDTAIGLTSSDSNLSDLKVTWYNGTTKLEGSSNTMDVTPNVGVNSVYAVVSFTYYGEPYDITTSTIDLTYECATIMDAQSSMTGYGISHTLSYDTATTASYIPFASTASYQWEVSTDGGKTWTADGKATSSPTSLTYVAWSSAEYKLVITDTAKGSTATITSNTISISADLTADTATVSASSTNSNVVTSSDTYNGSHVEIFYDSDGSATLTVGLSEGKYTVSDLSKQTDVTYTWTITPWGATSSTKATVVTTTTPTLSDTFFEKYGACTITLEVKVGTQTLKSTDSWIITNSSLAITTSSDASHLLANDTSSDQISVTEGATVSVNSTLTASEIKTKETLPSGDTYVLLSGTTDSLKDAKVVTDNTSGKDSGVFTITEPSTVSANESTYYWVEAVSGTGTSQVILATSNAYEVTVIAPISASQTTTPTTNNGTETSGKWTTAPSVTFAITYSKSLPVAITPTVDASSLTLYTSVLGGKFTSQANSGNLYYSYEITNATADGFDLVFTFNELLETYFTLPSFSFYLEISNISASLSKTTLDNVFTSGLTIKTETVSSASSKFDTTTTKAATYTQAGLTNKVYPGDAVELRTTNVLPSSWAIQWQQKNEDSSWSDLAVVGAQTNSVKLPATYTQAGKSYTFRAKYTNNNTTIYSNETTYTVSDNGSANIGLTISDK